MRKLMQQSHTSSCEDKIRCHSVRRVALPGHLWWSIGSRNIWCGDISDVPSKDQSSWRYRSAASTAAEYETIMFWSEGALPFSYLFLSLRMRWLNERVEANTHFGVFGGRICWAELMGWSKFEATSHSCHAHLRRSLALQSSDEINPWQTGQRFYTKRMHLSANLAARNCNTQFAKPWPKGTRRTWGSGLFLVSNSKLSSVGIILCRK